MSSRKHEARSCAAAVPENSKIPPELRSCQIRAGEYLGDQLGNRLFNLFGPEPAHFVLDEADLHRFQPFDAASSVKVSQSLLWGRVMPH
jgi:hypothetical protein